MSYIGDEKCSLLRPLKELKKFCKIELAPGEEKEVSFTVSADDQKFYDDRIRQWTAEPGKFKAYIAASSADIRGTVEFGMCKCTDGTPQIYGYDVGTHHGASSLFMRVCHAGEHILLTRMTRMTRIINFHADRRRVGAQISG